MSSLRRLVRVYNDGKLLIDLTKITSVKRDGCTLKFYSQGGRMEGSGFMIGVFGTFDSSTLPIYHGTWKEEDHAIQEFNSIQEDLNAFYNSER
jgi:hypothetical protein